MLYALSAIAGYFLGSISISILVSKYIFKSDIRSHGSGNAGATNIARVYGPVPGIMTLLGDVCKAFLSALIGSALAGPAGKIVALTACLIGHCFPIYFKFKGGKAVSVCVAIAFLTDWRAALITAVVFFVLAFTTKRISVASMISSVALAIAYACLNGVNNGSFALLVFTSALLIFMHRGNIQRLIKGTEPEFHFGSSKK